ncbi:hypothetical protein M422DRAFT_241353 [Sphaerobolus stellatus SS14]|nr:hypothetical protein M422DRAFT_241353 [Sphaerobolus stellatus SS14]
MFGVATAVSTVFIVFPLGLLAAAKWVLFSALFLPVPSLTVQCIEINTRQWIHGCKKMFPLLKKEEKCMRCLKKQTAKSVTELEKYLNAVQCLGCSSLFKSLAGILCGSCLAAGLKEDDFMEQKLDSDDEEDVLWADPNKGFRSVTEVTNKVTLKNEGLEPKDLASTSWVAPSRTVHVLNLEQIRTNNIRADSNTEVLNEVFE